MAISLWDWDKSNGQATESQVRRAYKAITNQGPTKKFSYRVWNDMVNYVDTILTEMYKDSKVVPIEEDSYWWSGSYRMPDGTRQTILTKEETLMTSRGIHKVLTAQRFDSLFFQLKYPNWEWWTNPERIGFIENKRYFKGQQDVGEKGDPDKVYGWYFLELIDTANFVARVLNGEDYESIHLETETEITSDSYAYLIAPEPSYVDVFADVEEWLEVLKAKLATTPFTRGMVGSHSTRLVVPKQIFDTQYRVLFPRTARIISLFNRNTFAQQRLVAMKSAIGMTHDYTADFLQQKLVYLKGRIYRLKHSVSGVLTVTPPAPLVSDKHLSIRDTINFATQKFVSVKGSSAVGHSIPNHYLVTTESTPIASSNYFHSFGLGKAETGVLAKIGGVNVTNFPKISGTLSIMEHREVDVFLGNKVTTYAQLLANQLARMPQVNLSSIASISKLVLSSPKPQQFMCDGIKIRSEGYSFTLTAPKKSNLSTLVCDIKGAITSLVLRSPSSLRLEKRDWTINAIIVNPVLRTPRALRICDCNLNCTQIISPSLRSVKRFKFDKLSLDFGLKFNAIHLQSPKISDIGTVNFNTASISFNPTKLTAPKITTIQSVFSVLGHSCSSWLSTPKVISLGNVGFSVMPSSIIPTITAPKRIVLGDLKFRIGVLDSSVALRTPKRLSFEEQLTGSFSPSISSVLSAPKRIDISNVQISCRAVDVHTILSAPKLTKFSRFIFGTNLVDISPTIRAPKSIRLNFCGSQSVKPNGDYLRSVKACKFITTFPTSITTDPNQMVGGKPDRRNIKWDLGIGAKGTIKNGVPCHSNFNSNFPNISVAAPLAEADKIKLISNSKEQVKIDKSVLEAFIVGGLVSNDSEQLNVDTSDIRASAVSKFVSSAEDILDAVANIGFRIMKELHSNPTVEESEQASISSLQSVQYGAENNTQITDDSKISMLWMLDMKGATSFIGSSIANFGTVPKRHIDLIVNEVISFVTQSSELIEQSVQNITATMEAQSQSIANIAVMIRDGMTVNLLTLLNVIGSFRAEPSAVCVSGSSLYALEDNSFRVDLSSVHTAQQSTIMTGEATMETEPAEMHLYYSPVDEEDLPVTSFEGFESVIVTDISSLRENGFTCTFDCSTGFEFGACPVFATPMRVGELKGIYAEGMVSPEFNLIDNFELSELDYCYVYTYNEVLIDENTFIFMWKDLPEE